MPEVPPGPRWRELGWLEVLDRLGAQDQIRFGVTKTIIPAAQEHFLALSARRDTHLFGGLGLDGEFNFRIVRPMGVHEMLQSRGADGA